MFRKHSNLRIEVVVAGLMAWEHRVRIFPQRSIVDAVGLLGLGLMRDGWVSAVILGSVPKLLGHTIDTGSVGPLSWRVTFVGNAANITGDMGGTLATDCLFCKVVSGEVPSEKLYESDSVVAFRDINPQAPTHVLVVPRRHVGSAAELGEEHSEELTEIFRVCNKIAKDENIDTSGYRIVTNVGRNAGQSIFHLHFHLLGGRPMTWPPG